MLRTSCVIHLRINLRLQHAVLRVDFRVAPTVEGGVRVPRRVQPTLAAWDDAPVTMGRTTDVSLRFTIVLSSRWKLGFDAPKDLVHRPRVAKRSASVVHECSDPFRAPWRAR